MSNNRAALRYAKAFYSLSLDEKIVEKSYADMQLIAETIDESEELQKVLSNSILQSDEKKQVLLAIFKDKLNALSLKLIDLLIANKRLSDIGAVAKQFVSLCDAKNGKEAATVTTAIPLTAALTKQVLAKIKEITGKEAVLESVVNPDIIGGFILRIGDLQYDSSFENKLREVKKQLIA